MKRRTLWLIAGVLGVGALVALVCGGGLLVLLLLLSTFLGEAPGAASVLQVAGLIGLGIALGIPLALQGWAGWRERPSRPFNPSRTWWAWLALMPTLVLLIALGAVVSGSLPPALALWLLLPIHVLAMIIPPLLILGLVGWGLRGMGGSRREVVAGMAGGGFLGTAASLVSELALIAFAAIVGATIYMVIVPDGSERIAELMKSLQDPTWQAEIANVLNLLLSPVGIVSALGVTAVAIPLIEETAKTLVTGIAGRWIHPHPARAFLWGVTSGAGFALAENLLNGAMGGVEGWPLGAITRIGATAMHCFTSGLAGWGWGQLWTARRPLRLLGSYAAAVITHGLWNGAAVGAVLLNASILTNQQDLSRVLLAFLGILVLLGILGLLTVLFIVVLPIVARRLTAHEEHPQAGVVDPPNRSAPAVTEAPDL